MQNPRDLNLKNGITINFIHVKEEKKLFTLLYNKSIINFLVNVSKVNYMQICNLLIHLDYILHTYNL